MVTAMKLVKRVGCTETKAVWMGTDSSDIAAVQAAQVAQLMTSALQYLSALE